MTTVYPPFPDHVRRRPRAPRRRWLALLVALTAAASPMLPSLWTVRRVRIEGAGSMPAAERANLELLVGTPLALVDPAWVRDRMELWPGATSVEVRRELDGTLSLRQRKCPAAGSVRVGRGWHAVCPDGSLGGRLQGPLPPVLEGLPAAPAELRSALAAADRVRSSGLGEVSRLRAVLPGEVEAWVGTSGPPARLLLATAGSPSESGLRDWLGDRPLPPGAFADVSRDDRVVVALEGEGGT